MQMTEAALSCGAVTKLFYGEVSNGIARQRTIYPGGENEHCSFSREDDMESLSNVTFDEIKVGDTATIKRRLSKTEVEALALVGGDVDAFQIAEQPAKDEMHTDAVGAEALLSGLLNRKLPGPGTSIDFRSRAREGKGAL